MEEDALAPKQLLPFMKKLPAKRVVHLPDQAKEPLRFSLSYNSSWPRPSGLETATIANFDITGA